jgi:hypothetical protein
MSSLFYFLIAYECWIGKGVKHLKAKSKGFPGRADETHKRIHYDIRSWELDSNKAPPEYEARILTTVSQQAGILQLLVPLRERATQG